MTEIFTMDMFSGHVNTKFLMHYGDSRTAEIELISVTDVGSSARQSQFSLQFAGPGDGPAAQGIFRLDHETLGALDFFLVPIARDKDGLRYEAVFNRVIEQG
jgi:hypothetical protein